MKATDMRMNDYFGHVSPTYGDSDEMASKYGFTGDTTENLGRSSSIDTEGMVQGWMNSYGHRMTVLSSVRTEFGSGIMPTKDGSAVLWVNFFYGDYY